MFAFNYKFKNLLNLNVYNLREFDLITIKNV